MAELFAQIACAMPRELAAKSLGWQERAVYTEAIYYGRENLTDGVIDRGTLAFWMPDMPVKERIKRLDTLRERGALLAHPDGWCFPEHVWFKWGKTKAQVDELREKEAERKKKYREKNKAATGASENVPTGRDVTATRCPNESEIQPQSDVQPETETEIYPSSSQHNSHPQTNARTDDDVEAALSIVADILTAEKRKGQGYRATIIANGDDHRPLIREWLAVGVTVQNAARHTADHLEPTPRQREIINNGPFSGLQATTRHPAWCECEGHHVVSRPGGYVPCTHTSWHHLPDATIHPLRGTA